MVRILYGKKKGGEENYAACPHKPKHQITIREEAFEKLNMEWRIFEEAEGQKGASWFIYQGLGSVLPISIGNRPGWL